MFSTRVYLINVMFLIFTMTIYAVHWIQPDFNQNTLNVYPIDTNSDYFPNQQFASEQEKNKINKITMLILLILLLSLI